MNNYVLGCAICHLLLNRVFEGMDDTELLAIRIAHQENADTLGHIMDIIPISRGIKPEHLIMSRIYKEAGYKLAHLE